ncbi:MAG TPA: aminopeptidase N [Gammaproteobacteria bacterium]|jgi:aminopeptidase N|nr:aminopeptidase N [Gammaproteobacteria bacterium]
MSETQTIDEPTQTSQTVYLKDYQPPAYLIDEIDLRFDLHDEFTRVSSLMRIRHQRLSKDTKRELVLNGEELTLESIKLDGKLLQKDQYRLTNSLLIVHHVPDNFELEIVVTIYPEKNTALSGLYRPNQTYCTQCEAEGFRRITYFMDHPDVLSRFTTVISADQTRYPTLLSNGNLIDKGTLENGRHWVKWEDPFKKPSYLFALVAGAFDLLTSQFITQSGREITLSIYVETGYGNQADHAMYCVKEAMRWDEVAYGREYDLDIYMIVAIGDFNMGAMENKGLNIFNTKYILAKPETATDNDYIHILSVIGHEYFHNWSGNRVTCRDWFQLSLKEGLTIFRDQSFTEDVLSRAVMRIMDVTALRETQFPEDAGPLAHPVRPDSYIEINNFYTATVYNKGAEVLRMMQTILGKPLFRKGMDLYFASYDGEAVTIEDFVKTMEDVSGLDLTQFRRWYDQAGTPVVTVKTAYDATNKNYQLTLSQSCPPTPGQPSKLPMYIPIKMGLLSEKGEPILLTFGAEAPEEEKVLHLTEATQTFTFSKVPTKPIPSLLRNFSAPIKLHYEYTDSELALLFEKDTDTFNRWEAGQKYTLKVILALMKDYYNKKPLVLPDHLIEMYRYLLTHEMQDKYLSSEMLVLPSAKYIGEQLPVIEVEAIHAVREFILSEIATQLEALFVEHYEKNHEKNTPYAFNIEAIGKRQLKNRCLAYLMRLPSHVEKGVKQFYDALHHNMTDTQAALVSLNQVDSSARTKAFEDFYATWQHDALVVDKWLAIQAASPLPSTLQHVKQLMTHPAFDIKNPNKVYALIGSFGQNMLNFNAKDGAGYVFLRETIARLDPLNPQIAARMLKPLTTWKRYDIERQALMQKQLELLLQDKKISTDLYELVTKSLQV